MAYASVQLCSALVLGYFILGRIASRPQSDSTAISVESTVLSVADNARFGKEQHAGSILGPEPGPSPAPKLECHTGEDVPYCKGVLTATHCTALDDREDDEKDDCCKTCSDKEPQYTVVGGEFRQCGFDRDTKSGCVGTSLCRVNRFFCCFHCQSDGGVERLTSNVVYPSVELDKEVMTRSTCANCQAIARHSCSLTTADDEEHLVHGRMFHIPRGTFASTCAASVQQAWTGEDGQCPEEENHPDLKECPGGVDLSKELPDWEGH